MKKILLILEREDVLASVRAILEKEKYSVLSAINGECGLLFAKRTNPDLIISDIDLPGIDGFRLLKELREDTRTVMIPFIFLTTHSFLYDFRRAMEMGADDFLFRPFDPEDLVKAVNVRLLKNKRIKRQIAALGLESSLNRGEFFADANRIFITKDNVTFPILLSDVEYFSARGHLTAINTVRGEEYLAVKSIAAVVKHLPVSKFIRINRSVIVNMDFIAKVEKEKNESCRVMLKTSEKYFTVSRPYLNIFKSFLHISES